MAADRIGALVLHEGVDQYLEELRRRFPGVAFHPVRAPAALEALGDLPATLVYSCVTDGFPRTEHARLRHRPGLEWVHVGGSGFEHMVAGGPPGFLLTNGAGVLAPELAQTLVGALIALNRGFHCAIRDQAARRWRPRSFAALGGQSLAIVGTGAVGTAFATLAKAQGLRVIGVARKALAKPPFDEIAPLSDLASVAAEVDCLSLNVRLTETTRHLVDAVVLDAMRPSAFLLNAARGAVVDEGALVRALETRRIAGAYLDVFETEPLPASSPLWALDNVLITSHCSDRVLDWELRHARFFMANLERRLEGRTLLNRVCGS